MPLSHPLAGRLLRLNLVIVRPPGEDADRVQLLVRQFLRPIGLRRLRRKVLERVVVRFD